MKKRALKYIIGLRDCAAVARQDDGFQLNFKTQHIKKLSRSDLFPQRSIFFVIPRLDRGIQIYFLDPAIKSRGDEIRECNIKNLSRSDSSLQSSILNPQPLLVRLHDRWNCFAPIQRTAAS
ncbi:MAG: hypothetical protein A2103_00855 [Gammaproteobacteria bacterium GWF2_41_13]|nr:MAG: hypothetical protein A2103_00855 [Gammaproteobacteria bacterium GWF2_41_13]